MPIVPPSNSIRQHSASCRQRAPNWQLYVLGSCPSVNHALYFVSSYLDLLRQILQALSQLSVDTRSEQELAAVPVPPDIERGPSPSFIQRAALTKLDWSSSTMCPRQSAHCIFEQRIEAPSTATRTCKQADQSLRVVDPSPRRGCVRERGDTGL